MEEKGLELSWNDCPKDESCYLYVGDHFVGEIQNEIEFMWIRTQIAEQKFGGCHIMFRGKKYEIDENSNMENRPNNLFTTYTQLLVKYLNITQISRDKKAKAHIPTSKIINQ